MMQPIRGLAVGAAIAVVAGYVYAAGLDRDPVHPEERRVEAAARLFETGGWRDARGTRFPVFIAVDDEWLAPVPTYGTAAIEKTVGSNALPSRRLAALAGTASVALLYGLALELFDNLALSTIAALVFALDPAQFLSSRHATSDGIWTIPFVLLWLIALTKYMRTRSPRMLSVATAVLAGAVYAQPSAPLLVCVLTMVTAIVISRASANVRGDLGTVCLTGGAVVAPLVVWFVLHPQSYAGTFGAWLLHPAHIRNPLAWARSVSSWFNLTVWVELYWDFFDPTHLFANDTAPILVGVFLLPVGVLIVIGVIDLCRHVSEATPDAARFSVVLVTALLCPIVVAAFKEPRAVDRALPIVPLGALFAARGVRVLWAARAATPRVVAVVLLVAAVGQFLLFYRRETALQISPRFANRAMSRGAEFRVANQLRHIMSESFGESEIDMISQTLEANEKSYQRARNGKISVLASAGDDGAVLFRRAPQARTTQTPVGESSTTNCRSRVEAIVR